MTKPKISAILLAAGLSRRMGRDKLLLPYLDKTLLQHASDLLGSLPACERIIVTTSARVEGLELSQDIQTVINLRPEQGQSGSIKLGIAAASGDMYLFLSADQPSLNLDALRPLLDAAARNPDKIIYPLVLGKPCMPCLFPARFRDKLLALCGDTGGRTIREKHPEACLAVEVKDPELFQDIDSDEDYKALLKK